MPSFNDIVLRLKQRLGVPLDKGIAELLGMKEKAFNARKARRSFPEDKLRAAAQQHPEWQLDVDYVLTGTSTREEKFERSLQAIRAETERRLSEPKSGDTPEARLIADYRRCAPDDQVTISTLAARLAAAEPQSPVTETKPGTSGPPKPKRPRKANRKG